MSDESDRPLGAKVARDGIPALRAEAIRMAGAIAACSAHLRIYQTKIDAVLSALAPEIALPADPLVQVGIEVSLPASDFETASTLIAALQAIDPHRSIDDCINEIFITGLAAMAHRLIP